MTSFTDSDGNTNTSQYAATINWGDGTPTSQGMISYNIMSNSFSIYGNHTYAEEGFYLVTVTINDIDGTAATATGSASVVDAPLNNEMDDNFSTTAGQTFNQALMTFNDGNPNATTSDYTPQINWGDGTPPTAGSVSSLGGNGNFAVSGSHAYTTPDSYIVSVKVNDDGGSSTTANVTITVTNPLSWNGGTPYLSWMQSPVANPTITTPFGQTNHVTRLADAGQLPQSIKVGRLTRWSRAALVAWIDAEIKRQTE